MPAPHTAEIVRLATIGSVDDGKSTLIGRLLYDCRLLLEDQLTSLREASDRRGAGLDLALITDGLRAEREQGITIDVAYRYFATPRRTFILADTPGHVQYTRNMATGTSTAQVALLLIDARRGLSEQARRHAFIASLLGVPHVVVCVNKMDLVGYSEERFDELRAEFVEFAARLDLRDLVFVPVAALHGDNVVKPSPTMPWYRGPTLLYYLETVHIASDRNLVDVRLPIQYVVRTPGVAGTAGRWYAGQMAGGVLHVGDDVAILPSGLQTRIAELGMGGPVDEVFTPQSVRVSLADDLDVSRGDMIVRVSNRPTVGQDLDVMLCSFGTAPLREGTRAVLTHTTRTCVGVITSIQYRIDVNTLHRDRDAAELGFNEIGRAAIRAAAPLFYDPYRRNHATGGLILVDDITNATVAAGIILGPAQQAVGRP